MSSIAERTAQIADRLDERVVGDDEARPHGINQFGLAHHLPGVSCEQLQDFVDLGPQLRRRPIWPQENPAIQAENEPAKAQLGRADQGRGRSSFHANTRQPASPHSEDIGRYRAISGIFIL
jgi:hypothetical protein